MGFLEFAPYDVCICKVIKRRQSMERFMNLLLNVSKEDGIKHVHKTLMSARVDPADF